MLKRIFTRRNIQATAFLMFGLSLLWLIYITTNPARPGEPDTISRGLTLVVVIVSVSVYAICSEFVLDLLWHHGVIGSKDQDLRQVRTHPARSSHVSLFRTSGEDSD